MRQITFLLKELIRLSKERGKSRGAIWRAVLHREVEDNTAPNCDMLRKGFECEYIYYWRRNYRSKAPTIAGELQSDLI